MIKLHDPMFSRLDTAVECYRLMVCCSCYDKQHNYCTQKRQRTTANAFYVTLNDRLLTGDVSMMNLLLHCTQTSSALAAHPRLPLTGRTALYL